jgi:hypothetical protein
MVFLCVFAYSCLYAIVVYNGRRLLLSIAVSPLICMYWLRWRYGSPSANVVRAAVIAFVALSVAAFYSTFRHYDSSKESEGQRSFSTAVAAIKTTSAAGAISQVSGDFLHYFAQYTTHFSLLTIQMVDGGQIPVEPLNSLLFIAEYPIPRVLWPDKAELLGIRLPTTILQLPYHTNWGLGIVANGYQEGGYAVIMLYAFLIVFLIRLVDGAVARQPDNWFVLAILCAVSPHFVTWIRGEPAAMTTTSCEAIVFGWGLGLLARFLYGTSRASMTVAERSIAYFARPGAPGRARI